MKVKSGASLISAGFALVLFDLCFNFLGATILNCLHNIYTLYLLIGNIFSNIVRFLRTSKKTELVDEATLIKNEVLGFKKVPLHMTFILGAESYSYKDSVKIITWCVPAGISHISFYSYQNDIDSSVLFEYICEEAKEYIPIIRWGKNFSSDIKFSSSKQINGHSWRPLITIHIYENECEVDNLIRCVTELWSTGEDAVGVDSLDILLKKHFVAPNPDLAVVCGDTLSYFGFPAWQLRITQISKIPTHHNITVEGFLDILLGYSKCEQRYGK